MLRALRPLSAQYERGPDAFEVLIAIQEADKAFRTSRRDQLIASEVSGVIEKDSRIRRGGRLTIGDRVYRIDNVMNSSVPGLSDLALDRIAGDAVPAIDATGLVRLDADIELDGLPVKAHVNPSVEVEEVGRDGSRVIVSRMMIAVKAADAASAGPGSFVRVDGRRRAVARVMSDGLGLVKLMV